MSEPNMYDTFSEGKHNNTKQRRKNGAHAPVVVTEGRGARRRLPALCTW